MKVALLPTPKPGARAVLAALSGGYPPPGGRSPTRSSAVRHWRAPEGARPSDLHVLGTPPAFILSQDQTLHHLALTRALSPPRQSLSRSRPTTDSPDPALLLRLRSLP